MRAKILSASAGSGKTYRLAYKFVHDTIKHYHTKPYLYRSILAVTFTNKATEEMKSRILSELNDIITKPDKCNYLKDLERDLEIDRDQIIRRAKGVQTKILHDYSRFTILTIDKFFQRILRAFLKELSLDLNYNIELDTASILERSADALIEDIRTDDSLRKWITTFTQELIDENTSWDVRKRMVALGREIFKEKGKNATINSTSKETLLKSIKESEAIIKANNEEISNAGKEAMILIEDEGLSINDFTGKSKGIAQCFADFAECKPVNLTARRREYAYSAEGWTKSPQAMELVLSLQIILQNIIELYDKNIKLENSLNLIKKTYRSYVLLQDIYRKVLELCDQDGVMLLPETKYILSRFIAGNDAPFIYEKIGNRFERFMIDEFQDTSLKEWENFIPLLQNSISQSDDNSVFIVGDVKQSIYRWRGGDWRILKHGVRSALGKEDTTTEFLSDNYRSLPQIVEFNNGIIEEVAAADNDYLNNILAEALNNKQISEVCHNELHDTLKTAYENHAQNAKRKHQKRGYVHIERFNEDDEHPLTRCIEDIVARGYSYNDIMILYRNGSDGAKAANLLLDYKIKHNASFNIMTQDSLVVGKAAINNFVIALLRLSQNSGDMISQAIVNDYLQRDYTATLPKDEQQMLAYISQLSPEQAFEQIVLTYGLDKHTDEIAYLQALHEQIISFCASKIADIQLFLNMWDESGNGKALSVERSESTIELTTIHKAKGLEKKVVIIPFCNWGVNPIAALDSNIWAKPDSHDTNFSQLGSMPVRFGNQMKQSTFSEEYYRELTFQHVENINLLYVALTRAKEELHAFTNIPKRDMYNIGKLLWENTLKLANSTTDAAIATDSECVEFGLRLPPEPQNESDDEQPTQNILLDSYPTSNTKLALRLNNQRYFEEGGKTASDTPRTLGITMHSILSQAKSADEIKKRITSAQIQGELSAEQAQLLTTAIEREFEQTKVQEWFGSWDCVYCEQDIIGDHTIGTRRPDRVMIRGEHAVVVDYKFGEEVTKSHRHQIQKYIELLNKMGYRHIEGYIWYINLGKIIEVDYDGHIFCND